MKRPTIGFGLRLVYLTAFVTATLLVAAPLLALVYGSFRSGGPGDVGGWTVANWAGVGDRNILLTVANTLLIAGSAALLSTGLGSFFAWVVHRTDFRHKTLFTGMVGASFIFPGFILAMAWIILGSPGGIVNAVLQTVMGEDFEGVNIYSAYGIVWIETLHLIPIVFFTLRGPLLGMDSSFEEAASVAGAKPVMVIFRVTLPLMAYPIMASLLLAFVLAVEQFAIPALVGIPGHVNVLATELYLLVSFQPAQPGLAAALGLALTAVTSIALFCQRRVTARINAVTVGGKSPRAQLVALRSMRGPVNALCLLFALTGCVAPILALLYTSVIKYPVANPFEAAYTWRGYQTIFDDPSSVMAFVNTLVVSGGGGLFALALGAAISFFIHRTKLRGSRVLEAISSIPFGVPGIVVGLGFLWSYIYLPIYGTLLALIFCYVSRFLPYAMETVSAQLRQIDKSLDEAAMVSGARPAMIVWRILLPLLRPALMSAFFLLFVTFFREIAAATLLYTPSTEVIAISIWTYFENADWGRASALSVIASLLIFVIMLGVMRERGQTSKSPEKEAL